MKSRRLGERNAPESLTVAAIDRHVADDRSEARLCRTRVERHQVLSQEMYG